MQIVPWLCLSILWTWERKWQWQEWVNFDSIWNYLNGCKLYLCDTWSIISFVITKVLSELYIGSALHVLESVIQGKSSIYRTADCFRSILKAGSKWWLYAEGLRRDWRVTVRLYIGINANTVKLAFANFQFYLKFMVFSFLILRVNLMRCLWRKKRGKSFISFKWLLRPPAILSWYHL